MNHQCFFPKRDCSGLTLDTERSEVLRRFSHFVDGVLSRRDNDSSLFALKLVCPYYGYLDDKEGSGIIEDCLRYAVGHNVQRLYLWITIATGEKFEFPSCLTNCESLQFLKLKLLPGFCRTEFEYTYRVLLPLIKPLPLRLPNLKTLHIKEFWDSSNFIAGTVEHSPCLETLILDGIGTSNLNITAPKLRRLDIYYKPYASCSNWHYESVIAISAPRLTSFKLRGVYVKPVFFTESLPCLDDVYIDLCPNEYIDLCSIKFAPDVMDMLGQLGQAKFVTLSSRTLQVIGYLCKY